MRALGPKGAVQAPAREGAVEVLRRRLAPAGGAEQGQIVLLSLAFGVLVLALVLVVASASAVHIERKRLLSLADGAAADAADAVDVAAYYAGEGSPDGATRVPLSDDSVEAAVQEYLRSVPPVLVGEFDRLRVAKPTGTPDGTTAQVTLAATARPPLVPWVLLPWSDGVALRVTSTARAG